jgi:hypothetical protein
MRYDPLVLLLMIPHVLLAALLSVVVVGPFLTALELGTFAVVAILALLASVVSGLGGRYEHRGCYDGRYRQDPDPLL